MISGARHFNQQHAADLNRIYSEFEASVISFKKEAVCG